MRSHHLTVNVSAFALAMAAASAASAQVAANAEPPAAATAAPVAAAPQDVGDIVVTARKRSEFQRDVPVAITALSGAMLQQKNISQIVDLTVTVPNLSYTTASTLPLLFIRGVGSGTNEGFDQSTAKFVNNVYFGQAHDAKIPIFDVERIEVLKGPQVITFGNSATAGALNISTVKPGKDLAFDGSAAYEFENRQTKFEGGITAPLAEGASFRLAGIFDNLARGNNYNALLNKHEITSRTWAIRPTLKLEPAPDLTIVLLGEHDFFRSFGSPYQAIMQPRNPAAPQYPEINNPDRNDQNYDRAPVFGKPIFKQLDDTFIGDIQYNALGGTFTSTTSYRTQRNQVQLGLPGSNYNMIYFQHTVQTNNQFSQELRFNGTYGALDINVGGYYERSNKHIEYVQNYMLGGFGITGPSATPTMRTNYFDQRYDKYSGVVDATYRIIGGFSVSAGVRYSRYEKDAGAEVFGGTIIPNLNFDTTRADIDAYRTAAGNALLPTFGAQAHVFPFGSLKYRESDWQPQAIAQYKFGENMLYAKYVKGDKAGGFDALYGSANPNNIQFGTESGAAVELGLKGLVLDRKLDYAITLFRQTFTGLQQSFFLNTAFIVSNAGKARSQGVELEMTYRPVQGLRLGFNGAYLDAKFVDFTGAPCNTIQVYATPVGCTQDRSGTPLQYASKWTGTVSADYEQPVGNFILGGGASVFYRSKFNVSAVNDPASEQHGFAMVDTHLDLKPAKGVWSLSFFTRNLSNIRYLSYATTGPGNPTALLGAYERGRQLGLQLRVKY